MQTLKGDESERCLGAQPLRERENLKFFIMK